MVIWHGKRDKRLSFKDKLYNTNNGSWENLQILQIKKIYKMVIQRAAFSDTIILWKAKRFIILGLVGSPWCREPHGAYHQ